MFKKYLILILFFFSILFLPKAFSQQIFAATPDGQCYQLDSILKGCPNQKLVTWGTECRGGCDPPGKGSIFECKLSGINFYPSYCCESTSDDKTGEDIAFENQLDCSIYYDPTYKSGCSDNGKRYSVGSYYCKDNKVMECGAGGKIIRPSTKDKDCSEYSNPTTNLNYVCYEQYDQKVNKSTATCLADDKFGETCGDPILNNDRCCCINVETATTGIKDDQFGINAYINRASSMVMGQINEGGDQFKQMNRIQSACVTNYQPITNGKNLYDIFGSDRKIDNDKLSANANLVCSADCKCVADPEQTEAGAICGRYFNKDYMTVPQQKELESCQKCFAPIKSGGAEGYWSAFGCIKLSSWGDFFQLNIFPLAIGFGGLITLLCIIFSAISIQSSAGNPEKIKKAQQVLTSCITGLIMIIFAIFILRLIGYSILKIPGFQ